MSIYYARKCSATGKGMNEGYVFLDGEFYCISKEDALKKAKELGYNSLEEAYAKDAYYYTDWDVEEMIKDEEEAYTEDGSVVTFITCHKCNKQTEDYYDFCRHCTESF